MRGECDVDVLALDLALGVVHAHRIGPREGVDGVWTVAGDTPISQQACYPQDQG